MDPVAALTTLGGAAPTAELLRLTTRARIRRAVDRGDLLAAGRRGYRLPGPASHRALAVQLTGTVSHLSAARHWGWALKVEPDTPWVTVPRGRRRPAGVVGARVLQSDLEPEEVVDGVTAPLRTVLDCARALPFDEALAVADSALRSGRVGAERLRRAAAGCRGPSSAQVRRVAGCADGRAANPFESVLRALVIDEGGLEVRPQVRIRADRLTFTPDLVDEKHRVVIEAESREFHTDERQLDRDCVRYSLLQLDGWLVLRFTWAQVMHSQAYVRSVLARAAELRAGVRSSRAS